jgi:hypothetical protein
MINLVKSTILKEQVKEYWDDSSKSVIEREILHSYIKDSFDIELMEEIFFFTHDKNDIINHKTIIKIFNNGKLIKRKLFWMGYDKWSGFNHEMLINKVLN